MLVSISDFKEDNGGRDIHVEISNQDIWNLDHTLALIIHPSLVKLKEAKAGAPFVDEEDVAEHLRMSELELKEFHDGSDEQSKWFEKWTYILNEMIWTFNQIVNEDEPLVAGEEYKQWQNRISNGLRLFGKYYTNLWT